MPGLTELEQPLPKAEEEQRRGVSEEPATRTLL